MKTRDLDADNRKTLRCVCGSEWTFAKGYYVSMTDGHKADMDWTHGDGARITLHYCDCARMLDAI